MKRKRRGLLLCLLLSALFLMSSPVSAARYKNQWVFGTNGRYYYYNETGKRLTGFQKINKKYYYFDSKGRQRNGWVKIGKYYYFFRNRKGAAGYQLRSTKQNGILLTSKGRAVINNSSREKVRLLTRAAEIIFQNTNWNMSRTKALKACFTYARDHMRYIGIGSFRNVSGWPEYYAGRFFDRGTGDCYTGGCGFAYLATALGIQNVYAISSGAHGWAEINGKIYDPAWADAYDKHGFKFFKVEYSMSGKNGVPYYEGCRNYAVRLD